MSFYLVFVKLRLFDFKSLEVNLQALPKN
jgi:hypothetical protein